MAISEHLWSLGLLEIVLMVFIIVDLELFTKFRVTGEVVIQTRTENRRSYSIKPMGDSVKVTPLSL